jgi:hypothetical protein
LPFATDILNGRPGLEQTRYLTANTTAAQRLRTVKQVRSFASILCRWSLGGLLSAASVIDAALGRSLR